jgi:hypothetical protein
MKATPNVNLMKPLGLMKLNRFAGFKSSIPSYKAAFNGESAVAAEAMYDQWKSDPTSVD